MNRFITCSELNRSIVNRSSRASRFAFTIPELLAVIALIVIIISILLPSFGTAKQTAWIAQCASNEHQIRIAIHGNKMTDGFTTLPGAGRWVYVASQRDAIAVLQCPAGEAFDASEEVESQQFDQLYTVQVAGSNTTISYITDIMAGQLATDPQLGRQWHGEFIGDFGEAGQGWIETAWGSPLDPNDHMGVSYNDDGGFLVEFSGGDNDATVHSLDAPGDIRCGSDHWVCIGDGGDDWQGEIVMRLTGNGHQNQVDPPVKIGSGSAHYGMNNLATDVNHRAGQILLMDYGKTIVRMNSNGGYLDAFDDFFAPRHFNKANVMRVDGSVSLMSRGELDNNPDWKPKAN